MNDIWSPYYILYAPVVSWRLSSFLWKYFPNLIVKFGVVIIDITAEGYWEIRLLTEEIDVHYEGESHYLFLNIKMPGSYFVFVLQVPFSFLNLN